MLAIHNPEDYDDVVPLALDDDSWSVSHEYNGVDTAEFEVAYDSEYKKFIVEENKVEFIGSRCRDSRFVIKNVDEHSDFITVSCEIDLEDWKKTIFKDFRMTNSTLEEVLSAVVPDGWEIRGQEQFTKRTTVEGNEGEPLDPTTPLGVVDACTEPYGVVFNFDVNNRVIYCVDTESYPTSGDYIMEDLNLVSFGFVGDSSNFATRLYAYGKQDEETSEYLTFASINNGKEYVEDMSFSDKVICVGWMDERYTVKEDLLAAAKSKLSELSKPTRSYECDTTFLQGNIQMYKVVTLIDRRRKTRVDHQIVSWTERARQEDDSVTLAATPPTIESIIDESVTSGDVNDVVDKAVANSSSSIRDEFDGKLDGLAASLDEAIEDATNKITGSYGGYFKWILDADGNPMELVNLGDSTDINKAMKVWRWNKDGLGHSNTGYNGSYELGLLADGSINANMMTVGIIRGGGSYWNLETGDLSLIGDFETARSGYRVKISPSFDQFEVVGDDKMQGSGIEFASSDGRAQNAYIASEMSTDIEGNVSVVVVNGGRVLEDDPGTWVRFGNRKNNDGEYDWIGAASGETVAMADLNTYRQYNQGSSSGYAKASAMSCSNSDSHVAFLVANSPTGSASVYCRSSTSSLLLNGVLTGTNGEATFSRMLWNPSTINAGSFTRYNGTWDTPPERGIYMPFYFPMSNDDTYSNVLSRVKTATVSGFTVIVSVPPAKVYTDIDVTWTNSTVGGSTNVCRNLDVNTSYINFGKALSVALKVLGVRVNSL